MKVKIEYDIAYEYFRYKVYSKNKWFHSWRYVKGFETLEEAKECAEELFNQEIYPLVYNSETDIR